MADRHVEPWTPWPADDAHYGAYTPAREMTVEEAAEHARKLAAKFDAAGVPRPEWLRGVEMPTEPTPVGAQGDRDDRESRSPGTNPSPGAETEEPTAQAPDAEIESVEGLGLTTEQIRNKGLVIDLPMESASADPKRLRYDDD